MSKIYIEEKVFQKIDFNDKNLIVWDYENCTFINCDFTKSPLSSINFSDCMFENCNLSLVKTINTSFSNINFSDCKLLGLHFDTCNQFLFDVRFENCILDLSSFYWMKIQKTVFKNSSLKEVVLAKANLTSVTFDNCDLFWAIFWETVLEKTNFETSYNYSIDLDQNKIKKAKFSTHWIRWLLDKYDIIIKD